MILDDVLSVLDDAVDRITVEVIASEIGVDTWEAEAALHALIVGNMCGEEPPGYFFTDARDPAYIERQAEATRNA